MKMRHVFSSSAYDAPVRVLAASIVVYVTLLVIVLAIAGGLH